MATETNPRLRDQRKAGHGWFDNEIYDVFGDELRQDGISVYMTLARLCWGTRVRMSLREMARHARMSKDTFARNLKRVIQLGLVIEHKGSTAQTASTYNLVDVKELAVKYLRASVEAERADVERKRAVSQATTRTVSDRDSFKDVTLVEIVNTNANMPSDDVASVEECRMVRQTGQTADAVGKKLYVGEFATEGTDFATEVSHDLRHVKQNSIPLQETTPIAPKGAICENQSDERNCKSCAEAAVAKVQRECGLSNPRLGRAILAAMQTEHARTDAPVAWNTTAERMVRAYEEFVQAGRDLLLFRPPGPRRFFDEGMWRDDALWPWDKAELRVQQRRSRARIGISPG